MAAGTQDMDAIDRKIVALLQDDASLSLAQIAHRVGLSQSPCWKRIQSKYDFLAKLAVPAGLYPGQYDRLETVGTWSFVMARADLDDAIGQRLAADLYKAERTGLLTKQMAETTAKNTLAAIPNPKVLQPGVAKYYKEVGLL